MTSEHFLSLLDAWRGVLWPDFAEHDGCDSFPLEIRHSFGSRICFRFGLLRMAEAQAASGVAATVNK
ncbi:MAG: hypothetical protein WAO21_08540 [Verrucomicrobiia bacterium]